jgi:hypothetical protein
MSVGLRELQTQFIRYMLGQAHQLDEYIQPDDTGAVEARLSIYANAYRVRLRQAIETDHEILWRYLGDELFSRVAEAYIARHPSSSPSLRHFADGLPELLAEGAPFNEHPELAELAGFERALMDVFDASDAERVGVDALRAIEAAQWPTLNLRFHPSVRIYSTHWNSVEIWKALKADHPPMQVRHRPTHWLLWRGTSHLSEFRPLRAEEMTLLSAALDGANFAELCECLLEHRSADAVSATLLEYLVSWLEAGLVSTRLCPTDGGRPRKSGDRP